MSAASLRAPAPAAPPAVDAAVVGDAAARQALLRCWLRDAQVAVPATGDLTLTLPATGTTVRVPLVYRSLTGWHRFGQPRFAAGAAVDAATLAALLVRESSARAGAAARDGLPALARVLDSTQRIVRTVQGHGHEAPRPAGFLDAEQTLVFGHPFHPAPKSREGATDTQDAALSPERRGRLQLHWFAADRGVVAAGAAAGVDPLAVVAALHGQPAAVPPGTVPILAHPWQAADVRTRPGVRALLDAGLLHDLGPCGPWWHPTSSVRTLYRPGAPVMLKCSLGLRITNSRRNNLRGELDLGVRAARLLDAGLAARLHRAHPDFTILRDPAWIGVDTPDGAPESGLETALRDNPFAPGSPVACVAGLLAERPGGSMIGGALTRLAARTGLSPPAVSAAWFARYLDIVATPLLWLAGTHGVALEAHQQNTLVGLDTDGWPVRGWYRDSQGWYVAASRAERLEALLPGFGDGVVFDDALVDERLGYYLGVNNLFGVVGALGAEGLADEPALLRVLRNHLESIASQLRPPPGVVGLLLDAPTLRCKANLLTCVDGRDELDGEVAAQSIYVAVPNPLVEVA